MNRMRLSRRKSNESEDPSSMVQGWHTQYTTDASASCWSAAEDHTAQYPVNSEQDGTQIRKSFSFGHRRLSSRLQEQLPTYADSFSSLPDEELKEVDGSSAPASNGSIRSLRKVISFKGSECPPIPDVSTSSECASALPQEASTLMEQNTEESFLSLAHASQVCQWVQTSVVKIVSQSTKLPDLSVLTMQPQEGENDERFVFQCPTTDLVLKDKVGTGGSCDVYEVESNDALRLSGHMGKYVWKQLAPGKLNKDEPRRIASALRDVWLEALTLSVLQDHPHIISLRGWSRMDMAMDRLTTTGNLDGFGLLLDRVDTTVHDQISNWRRQEWLQRQSRQQKHSCQLALTRPELQKGPYLNWHERLEIARDLASALEYIHGKGFMHRDVKSANVGLCWNKDGRPRVQLLDFGLAIECPRNIDGDKKFAARHFQAQVGTARYMAPEISRKNFYTERVDVYSFSILLWEIFTLEQPFADIPADTIPFYVTKFNGRPKIPFFSKSWPRRLRQLLQRGWHADMSRRPSMQKIGNELDKILQKSQTQALQKLKTKTFLKKIVHQCPVAA